MTFQEVIEKIAQATPNIPVENAVRIANAIVNAPRAWCEQNKHIFRYEDAVYGNSYKKIAMIKGLRGAYPYLSLREAKDIVESVID